MLGLGLRDLTNENTNTKIKNEYKKYTNKNVHTKTCTRMFNSNFNYESQNFSPGIIIVDRRMDRQTVMHLFLGNKRKRSTYVCNNRGASEKHVKRKKPNTRVYTYI